MKQNINLYQPAARGRAGLNGRSMLLVWAGTVAACLLMQLWLDSRSSGVSRELRLTQDRVVSTESELNQLTASMMAGTDSALEAELNTALRELDLRETILGLVSGDSAGDIDGFSAQLRSLARQPAEGVWLTRVRVSAPGARTTLEGRALSPEAVPLYLRQLSSEAALSGQRFDEFEIERPEEDGEPIRFSMNRRAADRAVQFARE
ncbi:MAG: PilN domain-containing protein [Gammaproteobacteria bacterium]|nr:PilN domain-containing protein [Gammaproteobacteria bacterium]NNF60007.1 PilN domain-containing protein [Gammaproteobacteria bacterium]NNM20089.1 PilN domain-containing protein [Gammaproteobacteria bacterium]